jgi:prepilin-type N-terminal cleavage/methylation domain-containing protein
MEKNKGFTLIELLVVIGIIGLLATLAVVSFGNAQQRSRDTKRLADIRAAISAFAAAAQDNTNNVLCNGTSAISAATQVSSLAIWSGGDCNTGTNVTTNYINLSNVKDPKYTGTCTLPLTSGTCNYTVDGAATLSAFTISFNTESSSTAGLNSGVYHTANQNGIVN